VAQVVLARLQAGGFPVRQRAVGDAGVDSGLLVVRPVLHDRGVGGGVRQPGGGEQGRGDQRRGLLHGGLLRGLRLLAKAWDHCIDGAAFQG
jgi:hypothetical protein